MGTKARYSCRCLFLKSIEMVALIHRCPECDDEAEIVGEVTIHDFVHTVYGCMTCTHNVSLFGYTVEKQLQWIITDDDEAERL